MNAASFSDVSPVQRFRTLILERIEFAHGVEVWRSLDPRLEIRNLAGAADRLVAEIRTSFAARKLESPAGKEVVTENATRYVPVPATWWDHLKQTVRDRFGPWMDRNLPPYHKSVALREDVRRIAVRTVNVPVAVTVRRETTLNRYHVCPHLTNQSIDHVRYLSVPDGGDGIDQRTYARLRVLSRDVRDAFRSDRSIVGWFPSGGARERFLAAMDEIDWLLSEADPG